jgi:hypothetical protein
LKPAKDGQENRLISVRITKIALELAAPEQIFQRFSSVKQRKEIKKLPQMMGEQTGQER